MDIKLKITRENEDGSADAIVDYDDEGLQVIVQYGVIAMLKEAIEEESKVVKKKVSSDLQMKLEESINSFYSIIDDVRLLYKTHGDRKYPMDDDEVANALLGLEMKAKMIAYWAEDAYEQCFEMNEYASKEVKARRAAIMGWGDDEKTGF